MGLSRRAALTGIAVAAVAPASGALSASVPEMPDPSFFVTEAEAAALILGSHALYRADKIDEAFASLNLVSLGLSTNHLLGCRAYQIMKSHMLDHLNQGLEVPTRWEAYVKDAEFRATRDHYMRTGELIKQGPTHRQWLL